ncbi:hypothetical protein N8904_00375 [Flavobacteriales bacterium]|jgi:hypothetical protein|nr:hypothetical protein [Flavobacteriales bacterium]
MKKLLLLLLLPACLLGQEKKPRKLYLEIKQGVGLPSIGGMVKSKNGNCWSVGVNTANTIFTTLKTTHTKQKIEQGAYVSLTLPFNNNLWLEVGLSTIIDNTFGGIISYSGFYYGKKIILGFNLGLAHMDDYLEWNENPIENIRWQRFVVFSPCIKFRV